MKHEFTVVVTPEIARASSKYVARCVEYDICVQGGSIDEVKTRFERAVIGHLAIAKKEGLPPFSCLPSGVPLPEGMESKPRPSVPFTHSEFTGNLIVA